MLEGMNARGLIEIAKALGQVDIAPGLKLFTREYFKKGRVVFLDDNHPAEVMKDDIFPSPFIVTLSDINGGNPRLYDCDPDGAIYIINAALTEFEKAMKLEI